jgi:hypothetical protein
VIEHECDPPDPETDIYGTPDVWICPVDGRVWEKHVEDEPEFYEAWYEPRDD